MYSIAVKGMGQHEWAMRTGIAELLDWGRPLIWKRRFRLRTLLLGFAVLAIAFSFLGWYLNRQLGQLQATERLRQKGIAVIESSQAMDVLEVRQPIPIGPNQYSWVTHRAPVILERPELDLKTYAGLRQLWSLQLRVCVLNLADRSSGQSLIEELDHLPFLNKVWCTEDQLTQEEQALLLSRGIRLEYLTQ